MIRQEGVPLVWADFERTSLPLKTPICSAGCPKSEKTMIDPGLTVLHTGRRAHQSAGRA